MTTPIELRPLEWTRNPRAEREDRDPFQYGAARVETAENPAIGMVHACNHDNGWTATAALYAIPCDSQQQAEAVAEWMAPWLAKLHAEAVAYQRALARAEAGETPVWAQTTTDQAAGVSVAPDASAEAAEAMERR